MTAVYETLQRTFFFEKTLGQAGDRKTRVKWGRVLQLPKGGAETYRGRKNWETDMGGGASFVKNE